MSEPTTYTPGPNVVSGCAAGVYGRHSAQPLELNATSLAEDVDDGRSFRHDAVGDDALGVTALTRRAFPVAELGGAGLVAAGCDVLVDDLHALTERVAGSDGDGDGRRRRLRSGGLGRFRSRRRRGRRRRVVVAGATVVGDAPTSAGAGQLVGTGVPVPPTDPRIKVNCHVPPVAGIGDVAATIPVSVWA